MFVGDASSSGLVEVLSGGAAGNLTVVNGEVVLDSGATASGTYIRSGDEMVVSSGGVADNTTVLSGGTLLVSGGQLTGGVIDGALSAGSGATLSQLTISAGGIETPARRCGRQRRHDQQRRRGDRVQRRRHHL